MARANMVGEFPVRRSAEIADAPRTRGLSKRAIRRIVVFGCCAFWALVVYALV